MPDTAVPAADRQSRVLLAGTLLLGLLLMAALAGGIAWRRGAFAPTVELYAVVDNAAGLAPGTTVRLSGVRVGEVQALELQPDLTVRMRLRVAAELMPQLRSDARALLIREQLRPPVVELEPGGAPGLLDVRDPKIAFRGRASIAEIADELRGRLLPILDDLKQVTGTLRQRQGDVAAVLAHAASAAAELSAAATEVHALTTTTRTQVAGLGGQAALLGQQAQGLLQQGQASVRQVGGLIEQVNTGLGTVNGALPGLLARADSTLGNLNAVAVDSRQIASAAAATLPGLLRSAPLLLDDSQELLQGVRRAWPLRSLLPAPPPAELPIQSHDASVLRDAPAR